MGEGIRVPNRLAEHRGRLGLTQEQAAAELARLDGRELRIDGNAVSRHERGRVRPSEFHQALYARLYGTTVDELWPVLLAGVHPVPVARLLDHDAQPAPVDEDYDAELIELARRAEASDVGRTALDTVDLAVADLARRYSRTPPAELLTGIRSRSRDVAGLLDGRATLTQRRRLLVAGGWLALLAATVHVDLRHRPAARAARDIAMSIGREAGEPELVAWAVEIAAWEAIVDRDWQAATLLARTGQEVAPRAGAAAVQLAAQEARATARIGDSRTVHAALDRAGAALQRQPDGAPTDHHFVFDPAKLTYYTATALSWLGDPAAEAYSREVIRTSSAPRRVVTARLDLGMVLGKLGRPDEAAQMGTLAVESGWLVPSNVWRAGELAAALAHSYPDLPEVRGYRDQYRTAARAMGGR